MQVGACDNIFDGSPSYFNPTYEGAYLYNGRVLVLDLSCPTFSWTSKFYISFGSFGWRFKNIDVYLKYVGTGY